MKTVKVTTTNAWKANQKNVLPYVGEVQYDENASFQVDESLADKLLEYSNEFYLEGELSSDSNNEEELKKKSEDQEELGKSTEGDITPQVEESGVELSASDLKKDLQKLSVKEIREEYLSLFPKEDVKDLTKKEQYIDFIVSNLVDA